MKNGIEVGIRIENRNRDGSGLAELLSTFDSHHSTLEFRTAAWFHSPPGPGNIATSNMALPTTSSPDAGRMRAHDDH